MVHMEATDEAGAMGALRALLITDFKISPFHNLRIQPNRFLHEPDSEAKLD